MCKKCEHVKACLRKVYRVCSEESYSLRTSIIIVKNKAISPIAGFLLM